MWLKYSLDKDFLPAHIHIMPSVGEAPTNLHNISSRLIIDNPAVQFTTDAKAGLYNQYSDEDYAKMLQAYSSSKNLHLPSIFSGPLPSLADLLLHQVESAFSPVCVTALLVAIIFIEP